MGNCLSRNRDFHFKMRFGSLWIVSNQKHFFEKLSKIFIFLVIFSQQIILCLFTLKFFWKFSKNKCSLSSCAFKNDGPKNSKNEFKILIAEKLTELQHFWISKILLKNCWLSKIVFTCLLMSKNTFDHKKIFFGWPC